MKVLVFCFKFQWNVFLISEMVQAMAWHQTIDNPFAEQVLIKFHQTIAHN